MDSFRPLALAALWLCLVAGAAGLSFAPLAAELIEAEEAGRGLRAAQNRLNAVDDERRQWREILDALRNDPSFREQWRQHDLKGLVEPAEGVPLDPSLRVDLRRPALTARPADPPPAAWVAWVEPFAAAGRQRTGLLAVSTLLLAVGLLASGPRFSPVRGTWEWLSRRYRLDGPHELRGPTEWDAGEVPATTGEGVSSE